MATKSKVHVLDVSSEDPASTHGATSVCLDLMRYVPTISEDGEKRKRMMVGGDQGVCERFRKAILGRAEEKKDQSLSALVCQPMDFHAQKVLLIKDSHLSIKIPQENLLIYRQSKDLPGEAQVPGSVSNVKRAFSHTQADKGGHNFYANENLLKVDC